jgi:hypothetical protein
MKPRHWDAVGDAQLLSVELTTDDPEALDNLVKDVPTGPGEPFVEFAYDLRKLERKKFRCAHCHQKHLAGVVVNKDGQRFLVGHICGAHIYGANFAVLKKDYDAAVIRQDILKRVREIRGVATPFMAWLDALATSGVLEKYDRFKQQFRSTMPWLREQLKWHTNNGGRRIGDVMLPPTLFDGYTDPHVVFATAAADISKDSLLFIGKLEIQKETSFVIERLQSSVSKIERAIQQLRELEEFFQPACLAGICDWTASRDGRARYRPGLMTVSRHEGGETVVVRMPAGYSVPDLLPLAAFRGAISGMSQKQSKAG